MSLACEPCICVAWLLRFVFRGGLWCAWLVCERAAAVFAVVVTGAGQGEGYGGAARLTRVLRRRRLVLGDRSAAVRRVLSSCRVFQAVMMRWLRTISRVVVNSSRV